MEQRSNYNKFLLLWSGELVSAIGSGLTSFGLGVYVFRETGSAADMALVALLAFLPVLLLSAPAGVLADRYDRRILMMAGDGLSALGLVYILICMLSVEAKLHQICIGVFISSVFSSLLEPSYRATVTDLLTKEEYSRAGGMVSIAGSARYLISPLIAGFLLTVSDVKMLLMIDIGTFFLTVICTAVVRKGISAKPADAEASFLESLDFQSSKVLGIAETVCACGMLVSSVIIGIRGLKKNFTGTLSISLMLAGLSMVGFGLKENILMICGFGFIFFFMLPFANNCLDYLVRTNIDAGKQGRAWGLISFLSQIGYVVAYGTAGLLADRAANAWHIGVGRGAAAVIMVSGALLAAVAAALYRSKDVRKLEEQSAGETYGKTNDNQ